MSDENSVETTSEAGGVSVDAVSELVERFNKTLETVTAPAPEPVATGPSQAELDAQAAANLASYEAAKARANELSAEGDVAGGFETLYQEAIRQSQQNQPDPLSNPDANPNRPRPRAKL